MLLINKYSRIRPTARIKPKMKSDRLLTTAKGSFVAKAGILMNAHRIITMRADSRMRRIRFAALRMFLEFFKVNTSVFFNMFF